MRVIISGGGTAGHVYPGLALAKELQRTVGSLDILYVGTTSGLESSLVPQAGLEFKSIEAKGLPRKPSLKAFATFFSTGRGTLEAISIIKRFKPDVVVGMGAYASLPMVGAAVLRQIPTVIHEQNAVPGLVNRVLGRVVTAIAVSYPEMEKFFPSSKRIHFTGNPVRDEILREGRQEALRDIKPDGSRKVLFVFGGSRGAQKINEAVTESYDRWRYSDKLHIIHATGKINHESVSKVIGKLRSPEDRLVYEIYPYIDSIGEVYSAVDLLVCRSGATTIAEITARGLPAVFIPYPYATDNHQEKNARQLEKLGAAKVILDRDLNGETFYEAVESLIFSGDKLSKMGEASKKFGRVDAGKALASLVIKVCENQATDFVLTE